MVGIQQSACQHERNERQSKAPGGKAAAALFPQQTGDGKHGSQRGGDAQAGRGCKRDPDVPAAAHRLHGLLEQIVVHGVHQAEKPIFLLHRNTPSSSSLLRSRARVRNSELRMRPEPAPQASAISAMLSPYQ